MNFIKLKQVYIEHVAPPTHTQHGWNLKYPSISQAPDVIKHYKSIIIDANEILLVTAASLSDEDGSIIMMRNGGHQITVANSVDDIYSALATEALEEAIG